MNRLRHHAYRFSRVPARVIRVLVLVTVTVIVALVITVPGDWWMTTDQKAQRLMERGEFHLAAQRFRSPLRRGIALFRATEYQASASEFARVDTAEGHFNRGTALVMAGQYRQAVEAFDRALALHPQWPDALRNQQIAWLRAAKVERMGGDMTGGELGADDIVFDKQQNPGGSGLEQVEGGAELSNKALQALWLRRVQTNPADFLRVKFAFQLATMDAGEEHP